MLKALIVRTWIDFWMRRTNLSRTGRLATRLVDVFVSPYKARAGLAHRYPQGYIAASAVVGRYDVRLGANVYIGDRVIIYRGGDCPPVELGDRVELHNDTIIEVGAGGSVSIGPHTGIQPRCQLSAYQSSIHIGARVMIAPACAFYPYDHGMLPGVAMLYQPLVSKGSIFIEDDAWLGYGVVVLSGVRIGKGAAVGAGSVVTRDVPDGAVVAGVPARIVKVREELATERY